MKFAPHTIRAEDVERGYLISVEYPAHAGVSVIHKGVVNRVEVRGSTRLYKTAENSTLLMWQPSTKPPLVTLHEKEPEPAPFLDLFEALNA